MAQATVRAAEADEAVDALRVVEGALLEVGSGTVRERAVDGDVLVAEVDGTVVGALVLDPERGTDDAAHVDAVAVTRRRRGRGIGRALVEVAAEREGALTADFREDVADFWRACDFVVEPMASEGAGSDDGDARYRGRRG